MIKFDNNYELFDLRLWRISLTEMVQKHPACLRVQSNGPLQPARGFPDGQVPRDQIILLNLFV